MCGFLSIFHDFRYFACFCCLTACTHLAMVGDAFEMLFVM